MSDMSSENVLRSAHNQTDATISISGFVSARIGHKITRADVSATVETYSFFDGSTLLYTLTLTYTDATQTKLASVERTA